ncbi:type II toxin-antitoxin system RelE/ParE family toxin [Rhizobium panacihumi]|uniref:type II toxin-antitoxin system RelE/ParE family toxin n=1 Tax=Rhizobium panacihumi TaxID=2008450 RepID=UPI003D794490
MARYRLSPHARKQLRDIWHDIAVHNEAAADRFLSHLVAKFKRAASHPEIGVARPDIGDVARMLVEGRYVAIYEPTKCGVEVVTIVHGMRDPSSWIA